MTKGCLVFIMGRQRAGKDTAADYLVDHYGFRKISLAEPVYAIARSLFAMEGKERGLLIDIGVKMREIDPEVFPKALWRSVTGGGIDAELPAGARIVVPDTRFPNEWDFFTERGGLGLRVTASQQVRAGRPGYHGEYELDPTETGLDESTAAAVIANEGNLAAFHAAIERFAVEHLPRPQKER